MSSTRAVYRDAIRFVRIVNACRQVVQSTVMLYVSFGLSTHVVNSCSLPDDIRFVRIVNACRQLVQSTVMLYVSFALSTYVVNSCCLP